MHLPFIPKRMQRNKTRDQVQEKYKQNHISQINGATQLVKYNIKLDTSEINVHRFFYGEAGHKFYFHQGSLGIWDYFFGVKFSSLCLIMNHDYNFI